MATNQPNACLSPKQQAFVTEYMKDCNGAAAAARAGYSPSRANRAAAENMSKRDIREEIDRRLKAAAARADVTAENVVRELAFVAFSDIGDILDFSQAKLKLRPPNEIPVAARRAIRSIKVTRHVEGSGGDARTVEVTEFKLWSKTDALDMLCKRLCLYQDRLQAVKTLLSLLPQDLAAQVWAGIVGTPDTMGPREVVSDGLADAVGPVQAAAGAA